MEIGQIVKEIAQVVTTHAGASAKVLLFGSHVKGNALPTSDLDIAIDCGRALDFETMLKIKEDVGNIKTLRSIDLVDLHSIDKKLKNSILKDSKEICMK